jgi:hypothetical protein
VKRCYKCKELKHESKFNKSTKDKTGLQGYCKPCQNQKSKEWFKINPSKNLLQRYGITNEEKAKMILTQGSNCAICKTPFTNEIFACVDHCHESTSIRGMLCRHCNLGLGHFKDSPKLLQRAIHYVDYHAKTNTTTPVPTGPDREGQVSAEPGAVPTTGAWQDHDDFDDYRGATQGPNSYRSAKEGR